VVVLLLSVAQLAVLVERRSERLLSALPLLVAQLAVLVVAE
jgi:hypothetical protein